MPQSIKQLALLFLALDNSDAGWQISGWEYVMRTGFRHGQRAGVAQMSRWPQPRRMPASMQVVDAVDIKDPGVDDTAMYEAENMSLNKVSPFQHEIPASKAGGTMQLTEENVEVVLDELRPFLISDGGNVKLVGIDGHDVILELQGACVGCASSEATMKDGIEKRLKEAIPDVAQVLQMVPSVELTVEEIDAVLDGIRPFLTMADAAARLEVVGISGPDSAPIVTLRLSSNKPEVQSVRPEIMSMILKESNVGLSHSGMTIEWTEATKPKARMLI